MSRSARLDPTLRSTSHPMQPRLSRVRGLGPHGFHSMVYDEWGEPSLPTLLCVHGLTRNGRDFHEIAAALAGARRVVCPDLPGRGRSEWLSHPLDYAYPVYLSDLAVLLGRLGVEEVDWLGTSLGGILGMMLAAQPGSPVRRLVLNDVGPFIPRTALVRILSYVGTAPPFSSLADLEAHLRNVLSPFGPLTDDEWARLADRSAEPLATGGYRLAYDPSIAMPLRLLPPADFEVWSLWDAVACPVLVLRGTESDVLTAATVEEMRRRKPGTKVVEFAGVGHAPALMSPEQIRVVREWLLEGSC